MIGYFSRYVALLLLVLEVCHKFATVDDQHSQILNLSYCELNHSLS
jgi:hypothetical protein